MIIRQLCLMVNSELNKPESLNSQFAIRELRIQLEIPIFTP